MTCLDRQWPNESSATARKLFEASTRSDSRTEAQKELAEAERKLERLSEAIVLSSEPVPALMEYLRQAESTRRSLVERLAMIGDQRPPVWSDLERKIKSILADWRTRFSGDIAEARTGLRELLTGPIMFTPCVVRGYQAIRFRGRLGLEGVFGGELW